MTKTGKKNRGDKKKPGSVEFGLEMPQQLRNKTPKANGVSLGKDAKGWFVYTHRARSASHKTIGSISKKTIESIEETG